MSWDGPFPPRAKPRRVEGGLKARSTRGAIGTSWWSKRFLDVLASLAMDNRLARGRAYARKGQVIAMAVESGAVTASVQGSRARPYRVAVEIDPFPAYVWATVEAALAEQAIFSAQMLAGQMPPDIEAVFAAAGAPLFPKRQQDLRMSCSCPDSAVPCKHLAATVYLLAEAFDQDPFQILRWRGRDRESLLASLRALRGADDHAGGQTPRQGGPDDRDGVPEVTGAGLALAEVASPPLAETLDRFWLPPVPLPTRPPTMDTEPDLLLRQLPTPDDALGGDDLIERLRPAYQKFRPRSSHSH